MAHKRLNVGCGATHLEGFVNIDIETPSWVGDVSAEAYPFMRFDVTDGLPFDDGSVDYIVAHHFLEHLPYPLGAIFLCECARVLAPGGTLTIVCPDFRFVAEQYAADPATLRHWAALLLYPQEACSVGTHMAAYDARLLVAQGEAAGLEALEVPLGEVPYAVTAHRWQVAVVCTKPLEGA